MDAPTARKALAQEATAHAVFPSSCQRFVESLELNVVSVSKYKTLSDVHVQSLA